LKGERRRINVDDISFEVSEGIRSNPNLEFSIATEICFSFGGQVLGEIPIDVELPGFVLEMEPGTSKCRLVKGEFGQAWASCAERKPDEGGVVEKQT
jgi:hypothetical protein